MIQPMSTPGRTCLRLASLLLSTVVVLSDPAHAQVTNTSSRGPEVPAGTLGQRQVSEPLNASGRPLRRIDNRLQNRVSTRIQNRIDRNYDGDPSGADRIKQAGVRASNTSPRQ